MRFTLDELTDHVIDCSIQIHRKFGGGILESVYEAMLAHLLLCRGIDVNFHSACFSTLAVPQ